MTLIDWMDVFENGIEPWVASVLFKNIASVFYRNHYEIVQLFNLSKHKQIMFEVHKILSHTFKLLTHYSERRGGYRHLLTFMRDIFLCKTCIKALTKKMKETEIEKCINS